jgi:hypothetical protein
VNEQVRRSGQCGCVGGLLGLAALIEQEAAVQDDSRNAQECGQARRDQDRNGPAAPRVRRSSVI